MGPQLRRKHVLYFTADKEKEVVKAREGETVSLKIRETRHHNNAQIVWTFGPEDPNMRIANVKQREVKSDYDERFTDRLRLDSQTGTLTIKQLRVSDSGVYMSTSISNNILSQRFNLVVYSSVCPPSIRFSAFINTNCSSVTVECCVENSRELSLSWYRERNRLKNTTSPDLSSRLCLALEIESHDEDDYICVAENPVDEKATKLHTEDMCLKKNREIGSWCQTEATVRLVISAVVGMALIVLVVDHIRLRR